MTSTSSYQQQVIEDTPEKALSFLKAISTKVEIRAAMLGCGYTDAEQAEGWKLLHTATGYTLGELTPSDDQKARAAIAELDAWDESGFRRIHAALGRLHPEQDAFVFAGLAPAQGAGAVLSVSQLLNRLDALEKSPDRAATRAADQAAIATLEKRGVTAEVRKRLRDLVQVAESAKAPVMDPSAIASLSEQRQSALVSLRAWYRDWSETARSIIHRRDHLVMMGLATRRKSKSGAAAPDATPGGAAPVGAVAVGATGSPGTAVSSPTAPAKAAAVTA